MALARAGPTCAFIPGATSNTSLKLGVILGSVSSHADRDPVVIYPLVRRQSETVSLGYVSARIMESVFAAIGLMSIISVVDVANCIDMSYRHSRRCNRCFR